MLAVAPERPSPQVSIKSREKMWKNDALLSGLFTFKRRGFIKCCLFLLNQLTFSRWIAFHLGRPSSMLARDVGIGPPSNPFLFTLTRLCKAMSRSAEEIYGRHHNSLLQMWRIAQSITDDLRGYDADMQHALGIGLEKPPQPGSFGMQQTILMTCKT